MTSPLTRLIRRLEKSSTLDAQAQRVAPVFDVLVANSRIDRALRGAALGHALHPILVTLPTGTWFSAVVLDLTAGESGRDASDRLIGLSALSALPAFLTGAAEWRHADPGSQRIGVVHAATNDIATALVAASWWARRSNKRALGVGLSLVAGGLWGIGGTLGGHISLARKFASHDAETSTTGADLGTFGL